LGWQDTIHAHKQGCLGETGHCVWLAWQAVLRFTAGRLHKNRVVGVNLLIIWIYWFEDEFLFVKVTHKNSQVYF
jgi:hypothetical protein